MRRRNVVFIGLVVGVTAFALLGVLGPRRIGASILTVQVGATHIGSLGRVPHVQFAVEADVALAALAEDYVLVGEARIGDSGPFFGLAGGAVNARGHRAECRLTLHLEESSAGPEPEELLALLNAGAPMFIKLKLWDGASNAYQAESAWLTTAPFTDTMRAGLR